MQLLHTPYPCGDCKNPWHTESLVVGIFPKELTIHMLISVGNSVLHFGAQFLVIS